MATNQNGSFLNFFMLGFGDEAIDNGQNLSLIHSNFSLNHVNGSDRLINSQLPLSDPIASIEFHHQNSLISRNTHPCIMWNKLRVRSFTNYEFSLENQLPLPSNYVTSFSEAQRNTQFLSSNSTMYRLLARRNNIIPNQTFHLSNKANNRFVENEPFSYRYRNQPINTKTPTTIDNDHHVDRGVVFTPTQMNVLYAPQIKRAFVDLNLNSPHNPSPSLDQLGILNLQTSNIGEPGRKLVGSFDNQTTPLADISSFDNDNRHDGRIHSVRGENGSYKCPKCDGIFNSPHKFSSHMRIHYKGESNAQKKRRFAARCKRKDKLYLVYSSEGLTATPVPLDNN